jgi:hypothetical protein
MAAFLDFKKAFDYVNPELLLLKLFHYGFDNMSIHLLKDYFQNRTQKIRLGSCFSEFRELKLGVPQGSILGPLLFLIFINDLSFISTNANFENEMFADDTTLHLNDKNLDHLISKFQDKFKIITDFIDHNQLIINFSKTNVMFFTNKSVSLPDKVCINGNSVDVVDSVLMETDCNDINLDVVDEVKLLGIQVDNKLNFKHHFDVLCKKVNTKLYCIKRLKYLPHNVKVLFFKAFILPHFDYCSSLFTYFSHTLILQIENFYNTIIYKMFDIDLKPLSLKCQYSKMEDAKLNILPFKYRLFMRFAVFSYKIMNKLILPSIHTKVTPNLNEFDRVLRHDKDKFANIIATRTKGGERKLSFFLSKFLNSFLKNTYLNSLSDFKEIIKVNLDDNVKLFNNCIPIMGSTLC